MNINKKLKILQPKYYSKFQCDPIKCHESCCQRWKIFIDKSTYMKYFHSENTTIKNIVKTGISINKASINDDDFAIINLNKEMMCPFLNQNNLCEIFINLGESSLSKTCKSYPRASILLNDVIERGLEMSCSVAAELALLNENGIELEYIMDTVNFNNIYIVSPDIKDLKQAEIVKEIRTTVIDILQSRTIDLSERLAIVGCFLNKVVGIIENSGGNHEEILCKIKEEKRHVNLKEFKTMKDKYQFENSRQFHILNTVLSMKFKEGDSISFFSKRYIECLMQVLDVFADIKDKELEHYYKISYKKYLKPYLNKKSYILENFLVNYIFIYSSKFFNFNNIWTSYLKLCVLYGLLKLNLVGLAVYHKEMNDELMLKLIQSLSKTIIQDKTYWQSVIKYLEEEKLIKYTGLMTLIL